MKHRLIFLLILLFSTLILKANKIDSLNSDGEVDAFLKSTFHTSIHTVVPFDTSQFFYKKQFHALDSIGFKKFWFKIDIDRDGYTDLVASLQDTMHNGSPKLVAVFSSDQKVGEGYRIQTIRTDYIDSYYPLNISLNGKFRFLMVNIDGGYQVKPNLEIKIDTIGFYKGQFINYSSNPCKIKIQKIVFETTRCYGRCPAFKLSLNSNLMTFEGISYNNEVGFFTSKTEVLFFEKIIDILNESNFVNFKNEYWKDVTDSPTYYLRIWYDNGKVKEIKDYPGEGNLSLMSVYEELFNMKFRTDWK